MLENKIKFLSPLKGLIPDPKPASFFIPQEYKDMAPYVENSSKFATVKKCIPFLDAYTSGYILPFPVDIEYTCNHTSENNFEGEFLIHESLPYEFVKYLGVTGHRNFQISSNLKNPKRTLDNVFKFSNPWTIKTPPGYSCIFVTPFNHVLPFELISGIVDTDVYEFTVSFPFYWISDPLKRVVLEAGSPMVLVIPFKRESWKMKIGNLDEKLQEKRKLNFFSNVVNNYKNKTWIKKSYK